MGKLGDKAPQATWNTSMKDLIGRTYRIDSAKRVTLSEGPAYVAKIQLLDENGKPLERASALLSGSQPVQRLDEYFLQTEGDSNRFPIVAMTTEHTSEKGRKYFLLNDPDELEAEE